MNSNRLFGTYVVVIRKTIRIIKTGDANCHLLATYYRTEILTEKDNNGT